MKNNKKVNVIFLIPLLIIFISCEAQKNEEANIHQIYDVDQLKEDFNILKNELIINHPGLYTYTSKKTLDSVFVAIEKSITSPSTAIELYRKLAILNGVIKDAHTQVISPMSFRTSRDKTLPRFPFAVHVENKRAFILRNLSNNNEIAVGWEILKINGELFEDVLHEILTRSGRDGYNKTGPIAALNRNFTDYYAVVKGCPDLFEIEFKDLQNNIKKIEVKAVTLKDAMSNYKKKYGKRPTKNSKPISYKLDKNTLVLKVSSFSGYVIKKAGQSYKKEFKNIFKEIKDKSIENLVVDIRNNPGGFPEVGDELLSYLISTPYTNTRSDVSITNSILNEKYYLKKGDLKHFKRLKFKKNGIGFDIIWNEKPTKPKKNLFKGHIIVLINGMSSSQSGVFSGLLKDKTEAIFIGEETGGNPKEPCGGDIVRLVLPNTKVEANIPLRKFIIDVDFENEGRGIIPDYKIAPRLNDKVEKTDNVMQFALQLINNSK